MSTTETGTLPVKTISLLGIPFDANSSYLRGPAQAPKIIREELYSGSSNLWTEDGIDLGRKGSFYDTGDVAIPDDDSETFAAIESAVRETLDLGHPLICLSGDHSVTYPTIKAFHSKYPDLTILHFDAHPDLYDELDGNRLSHACPFARIMEERLARRLVQVGVRTINSHQLAQASKFGVEVITMRSLERFAEIEFNSPLFISLDVDVLDPAFAPGISHYEPGGMSVREVLRCIQGLKASVVGADIVEYNPTRDVHGQTAMVCAKLLKEISAAILRGDKLAPSVWP
jgi:arginase